MKLITVVALTILVLGACGGRPAKGADERAAAKGKFTVSPIGHVRKADGRTTVELEEKYAAGLLGLDGWTHVYVYWWFDRNDDPQRRATLRVHPRGNPKNPLTGVFATRSPRRPNLIAMTLCKIISVKGNVVQIEKIDAFADTPVLDLKPYIPGYDTTDDAGIPDWLKDRH